jgi:hypothetical protein
LLPDNRQQRTPEQWERAFVFPGNLLGRSYETLSGYFLLNGTLFFTWPDDL